MFVAASLLAPLSASGVVLTRIEITSDPPDAELFLVKGTREIFIGKTPLTHEFKFHSERSIVRVRLKKNLFSTKDFEVTAVDKRLSLTLSKNIVRVAGKKGGKAHAGQGLQAAIEKYVQQLLSRNPNLKLEAPVTLLDDSGRSIVEVFFRLQMDKPPSAGSANQEAVLRSTWDRVGAQAFTDFRKIVGTKGKDYDLRLVFKLASGRKAPGSASYTKIQTRTEMKCEGGYKYERAYNPCIRTDPNSGLCVPGTSVQPVYDPCLRRVPVAVHSAQVEKRTRNPNEVITSYYIKKKFIDRNLSTNSVYKEIKKTLK